MKFITTLLATADNGKIPIGGSNGVQNITKVSGDHLINGILNTVYMWAGIACVLIIVVGGYIYATSAGDASGVTRGKNAILAAIIGLVVVTMAFTLTNFVIGKF